LFAQDVDSTLPKNADVEDLFTVDDYLKLYNWAFNKSRAAAALASTDQPINRSTDQGSRGRVRPRLASSCPDMHRDDFFMHVDPTAVSNFEKLFAKLKCDGGPSL